MRRAAVSGAEPCDAENGRPCRGTACPGGQCEVRPQAGLPILERVVNGRRRMAETSGRRHGGAGGAGGGSGPMDRQPARDTLSGARCQVLVPQRRHRRLDPCHHTGLLQPLADASAGGAERARSSGTSTGARSAHDAFRGHRGGRVRQSASARLVSKATRAGGGCRQRLGLGRTPWATRSSGGIGMARGETRAPTYERMDPVRRWDRHG